MANRALEHATEPDLLVDLHWTLAQCRMLTGESAESLATLDRALASPAISARHRPGGRAPHHRVEVIAVRESQGV